MKTSHLYFLAIIMTTLISCNHQQQADLIIHNATIYTVNEGFETAEAAAIERKNLDKVPEEGFQMENALTREQALRAMTIWAAKAQFEEDEKGSIEPGKFADFIVTRKDLMTMPAYDINTLAVEMTFVGGRKFCFIRNNAVHL